MNTALEYSTRVVQEGGRRCKKSTLNDLVHLTPLRIPLMNPPSVSWRITLRIVSHCNVLRLVAHYGMWCIVFWLVSQYAPATEAFYTVLRLVCIVLCFAAPYIRLMVHYTLACGALYSGMCALSCCTLHSSLRHIVLLQHRTAA